MLQYNKQIEDGILEIVIPPEEFYPKFDKDSDLTDPIYNDKASRIIWRRYQNYDFSYLMTYSMYRGDYFLMLEDDILAVKGFANDIFEHIEKLKNNSSWFILEYSELGFIGKLFRTRYLFYLKLLSLKYELNNRHKLKKLKKKITLKLSTYNFINLNIFTKKYR